MVGGLWGLVKPARVHPSPGLSLASAFRKSPDTGHPASAELVTDCCLRWLEVDDACRHSKMTGDFFCPTYIKHNFNRPRAALEG